MAITLGKRKRADAKSAATVGKRPAKKEEVEESDSEDLRDAFRRAFEAKFKPLPGVTKNKVEEKAPESEEEDGDESDEVDDEWDGISEGDEEPSKTVEVVEVTGPMPSERLSKAELKAFMSSKPPTQPSKNPATSSQKGKKDNDGDDADADAMNLKNDLALQRLLKESHLLDASSPAALLAGPTGKNRHKATDMRIQSLGSRTSILAQEKMPMAHRKGMQAKATAKEATRRREARENGIILEKEKKEKSRDADRMRERGVGGPGVGRFSGGTLRLSKQDVASITGEGRGGFGGKKRDSKRK